MKANDVWPGMDIRSMPGSADPSRSTSNSQQYNSDVGSSTTATGIKKRKIRHTRVKTGCRDCRTRRIKCPEGESLGPGVKLPCVKCEETGTECWYPAPDDLGRTTTRWVIAAQVDAQGRLVPREGATEMVVKLEGSESESHTGDHLELVKQEYYPPPVPFYHEHKQEPPTTSTAVYYPTQQPYFIAPEAPFGPSHQPMYAESALRNTGQMAGPRLPMPYEHPVIPPLRAERGITLDRIPKGIGTPQGWQAVDPVYAYASPVYGDPSGSSRTPYTSFPSVPSGNQLAYGTPPGFGSAGDFRLQLSRMPWVKRKPMHIDYTRQSGKQVVAKHAPCPTTGFADSLQQYLNGTNTPVRPLQSFTLASMSESALERTAVSYFETQGCIEIIAASEMKSNWIYRQVFPRVFELLQGGEKDARRLRAMTGGQGSTALVTRMDSARLGAQLTRTFVHHSLIRLCLVHRLNTSRDPALCAALRREIQIHGRKAMMAGLGVRVQCTEKEWKSEEYLMGAFIGYMADMLESKTFSIDPGIMASDPERVPSRFETILRDMMAVYTTLLTAFRPHDPLLPHVEPPTWSPSHQTTPHDWVESFFGLTRPMLLQIGRVNALVAHRAGLLRRGAEGGEEGWEVRRLAEALVGDLMGVRGAEGEGQDRGGIFEQSEAGKDGRIRRGTNVTRLALLVIVLCELLQVDLDDARLSEARERALEMVADSEPSETAGLSWALTVAAVYTRSPFERARLSSVLRNAQEWSFGTGYVQTTLEIMDTCWRVVDKEGAYRNGIAPWREAMAAVGRSMYL